MIGGGCGFAPSWSFSVEEAPLGSYCAQSPASVCVASPGHSTGRYKVKCSLCSELQVWWSLHWVLRQGLEQGDLYVGCGFAPSWSFSVEEAPLGNCCAQKPASVCLASPQYAMGHCRIKYNLCSVKQV